MKQIITQPYSTVGCNGEPVYRYYRYIFFPPNTRFKKKEHTGRTGFR